MKITHTQYLKKGSMTNLGKVVLIHDGASFKSDDGFSYDVREWDVYLIKK